MSMERNDGKEKELTSWKEIADFLGISERTAQKWEREKGLPVRRLPGVRARVFADRAELLDWRKLAAEKVGSRATLWGFRYLFVFGVAVALVCFGIFIHSYMLSIRRGPPAIPHFDIRTLSLTDLNGNPVWRWTFPAPFDPAEYSPALLARNSRVWVDDLDPSDPGPETLFTYYPVGTEESGTSVVCFSATGKEKWKFTPGREVSDRKGMYSPIYLVESVLVTPLTKSGEKRILITSRHIYAHPNQVVVLDAHGTVLGEYWHSGALPCLNADDFDGDGFKEIGLGGFNEGYQAAAVVLLDPRDVSGASTQGSGDASQILGFPEAREKIYILFNRTCISEKRNSSSTVSALGITLGLIRADVQESESDSDARIVYRLDRYLRAVITPSPRFQTMHREMELRGELNHQFSASESDKLTNIRILKHSQK